MFLPIRLLAVAAVSALPFLLFQPIGSAAGSALPTTPGSRAVGTTTTDPRSVGPARRASSSRPSLPRVVFATLPDRGRGAALLRASHRSGAPLRAGSISAAAASRAVAAAARIAGGQVVPVSGFGLSSVEGGRNPRTTAARIASLPGIAWAEVDRSYSPGLPAGGSAPARVDAAGPAFPGTPWANRRGSLPPSGTAASAGADPLRRRQWGLSLIHAELGWGLAGLAALPTLTGIPIGIVDTGADSGHDELRGRIRACGASFSGRVREGICDDRDGHGSHVAGIAAASTGNGVGIAGVAAASPLIVCRALGGPGQGSGSDVAGCIGWAIRRGARIISMSLGGPDARTLRTAIEAATAAGVLVVAASGNDGNSSTSFPAGYRSVVSVAAVGSNGRRAQFSNVNPDVEIAAPGVGILSLAPGNRYRELSGTSMATPHVSGAAALIWQAHRSWDVSSLRRQLTRSVREAGPPGRDREYGYGVLDLAAP